MNLAIETEELGKRYGDVTAVDHLSLRVAEGEIYAIFVATNPEISRKLGLVGAKANLMAYATTNWHTYLGLLAQMIAAGGFFLFCLIICWVFGREFTDGTLKDLLAVPVSRGSIVLAKSLWPQPGRPPRLC